MSEFLSRNVFGDSATVSFEDPIPTFNQVKDLNIKLKNGIGIYFYGNEETNLMLQA